jgi:oligoendopeptidase F
MKTLLSICSGMALLGSTISHAQASDPLPSWDLSQQFRSDAEWNSAVEEVEQRVGAFSQLRGRPIASASQLVKLLEEAGYLRGRAGSLARFALLTSAMDTTDVAAKARFDAATGLEARVESGVSWVDGATSALGPNKLKVWRASEPRLERHGWELNAAIQNSGHAYPTGTETVYAALERARLTATEVYDALLAADLGWPQSAGQGGASITVDPDRFGDLSSSRDTSVRRGAADAYYARLKTLEPTLGLLLTRRLEIDRTIASARHFDNGIDSFFGLSDGMPGGAYRMMIDSARANRAVLARYARTIARLNRLDEVHYIDLFTSAPDYPRPITLTDAQEIAIAAAAPMGADYQRKLRERFAQPWFDLPARQHKGGANGVYWGVGRGHPYAFISFRPNLAGARAISAVAGLTMFYADLPADKAPVRREDDFPIYGNAVWYALPLLQADYLYARAESRDERIALAASDLRRLWNIYFGGVVITDFGDRLETAIASGNPPAGPQISALYLDVLRDYYGETDVRLTDANGEQWMTLGNLFYGHVWDEWAFAMAAAAAMAERVKAGDAAAISAIAAPMSRPDSYSSYDLLRDAKANPTDPAMYEAVIRRMNADMDKLDAELATSPGG